MEPILFSRDGDVVTITLNRPDVGNLMTNEMGATLASMLDSASGSKLVVLRGAGKDFCLGRDLPLPDARSAPTALAVRQGNTEPALKTYAAFRRNTVPVLGVVTGGAIGFGCALAAACDLTFAAEDARFQLPEMNHGIPPCLAMSALIDRVPRKAIMDMVYSTDPLDAIGRIQRDALHDLPAHGMSDDVETLPAERIRECKDIRSDLVDGVLARHGPGLAVSAVIDERVGVGIRVEPRQHRIEDLAVTEPAMTNNDALGAASVKGVSYDHVLLL